MPYFQSVLIKQFLIWNQCIASLELLFGYFSFSKFSSSFSTFSSSFSHSLLHFWLYFLHFRHSLLLYFRLSLLFRLRCSLLLYFRQPHLCRFQLSISHFQCSLLHIWPSCLYNIIFVILWQTEQVRSAKDYQLTFHFIVLVKQRSNNKLVPQNNKFLWKVLQTNNAFVIVKKLSTISDASLATVTYTTTMLIGS